MKSPRNESTRSSWIPLCDVRNHNKHEDMEGDDQQHQIQKFGDHKFPEVQVPEGNKWFVKSWQLLMADTRTTINNREETIANNTTPFVQHGFWHVRVLEEKSWPRNSKKYRRICEFWVILILLPFISKHRQCRVQTATDACRKIINITSIIFIDLKVFWCWKPLDIYGWHINKVRALQRTASQFSLPCSQFQEDFCSVLKLWNSRPTMRTLYSDI